MKNVPINELQVGDCVEVQRDLNYSASGKPWKGSVGVITSVDNHYFPNVTYMVNFGSEMCGISAHDDNIKLANKGLCFMSAERFILDTNNSMKDQFYVTTYKCQDKYYLNLERVCMMVDHLGC
jgi:hypothetical protein